jgi:putative salt-induced outer membrane protein YdiY
MYTRWPSTLFLCALLPVAAAAAQDTIRLRNGNELTGTIKSMAKGELKLDTPMLGEVTVPMANVANLTSSGDVTLLTTGGERYRRRILGLEGDRLLLSDEAGALGGPLALDQLAELNPDESPAEWTVGINVGGVFLSGNTERRAVNAGLDAERRTQDDRITVRGRWDYAEDKLAPGVWNLSQRRTYGGMKYDYFFAPRWYVWGNVSAEGDTKADLDLRLTAGSGIGHQLVDRETFKLAVELGPSYLYEDYRTATTPTTETVAGRAAYTLHWDITDKVRFLQFVEGFVSLEDGDDSFVRKDSRLQTKLTENMVGQLQWILLWDNTPAPGNDRVDHNVNASLGWTF